jgi:hypothetical protein
VNLLADNDFVLKIASFNLLPEAIALFAIEPSDVYVLPTLKYMLARRTKSLVAQCGPEGIARAEAFIQNVREIDGIPDSEDMYSLNNVTDPNTGQLFIDPGEQVLFASARHFENPLLATGDKRCLFGLTAAPSCEAIHERLKGRVICLEQVLLWLIASNGFDYVVSRVVPVLELDCDKAIRSAFGSGYNASSSNVVYALQLYVDEVSNKTAGLLRELL